MSKRLASFAALALALAAVSLLVFQPVCEAREPGAHIGAGVHASATGDGERHPCCSIGVAAPLPAAAAEEPDFAVPGATIASRAFTPQRSAAAALASAPSLPVPRYHVRSARILS